MKQYDAIIIGFGKAGKTLAAELSNRGWQVAVVEQSDEMYGGACPNVACIHTNQNFDSRIRDFHPALSQ